MDVSEVSGAAAGPCARLLQAGQCEPTTSAEFEARW